MDTGTQEAVGACAHEEQAAVLVADFGGGEGSQQRQTSSGTLPGVAVALVRVPEDIARVLGLFVVADLRQASGQQQADPEAQDHGSDRQGQDHCRGTIHAQGAMHPDDDDQGDRDQDGVAEESGQGEAFSV
jgi:hypothetical protein